MIIAHTHKHTQSITLDSEQITKANSLKAARGQ